MTTTVQAAIALIKSAISGKPAALPAAYSMEDAQHLLQEQGLLSIGFVGAGVCGYPEDSQVMLYLLDYYCMEAVKSEQQMEQIQAVCTAFEENGIHYMPVKGAILKTMYPSHSLRSMSDADILIRQEQYEQIPPLMEALGFREAGESDHEYIWQSDYLKVELHKRLMPTYNKDYYSYFGEGWDLAEIQSGHRFSMTEENAFVYNFIHFAKHYRDGEGSSRFIIDLWVHKMRRPDMDMAYIRRKMTNMKMEVFFDNITRVMEAWFEDGPWDEVTERITEVLFNIDAHQRKQAHAVAQSVRGAQDFGSSRKAENVKKMRKIFPDRDHMNWSYPQWKKVPLPIAWVLRWCSLLLRGKTGNDRIAVTEAQRENYRKDLEYVGLEFSEGIALPD